MTSKFQRATRQGTPLKGALTGPSNSGKTTGALEMATGLANGGRIAMLDTENRSSTLYADRFNFDVLHIFPPFDALKFCEGIKAAISEGYRVAIIDSFSHAWEGVLDYKGTLDSRGGNSYANWGPAGKKYRAVFDAILQAPIDILVCARSKVEYVLEVDDRGRQCPRKVGMGPVARDGFEFEFTVVFDLDSEHYAIASKDRTRLFSTTQRFFITEETGRQLAKWRDSGAPAEPISAEAAPAETAKPKQASS
jgi:AAA domain